MAPSNLFKYCFLFTIYWTGAVHAQELKPDNVSKLKELKELLEDEEVAIIDSDISYEFYRNETLSDLRVRCKTNRKYLSLKPNTSYIIREYFDDESTIIDVSLTDERGKNVGYNKYCGHREIDGIFYSDAKICGYRYSRSKVGMEVNYSSELVYEDPRYLTTIYLQDILYQDQGKLSFKIPNWVEVELKEFNFENFKIKKTETEEGSFKIISYTYEGLKQFPQEEQMPGFAHFLPHLMVLTKSQTVAGQSKNILSNTKDLYSWYKSLTSGMQNDQETIKKHVNELLADTLSDKQKMETIFYWVQDNIKYIAFEDGIAGFQPENAEKVLYNRYGDCKGMANLLKEMMTVAGFDARLTWVGTRRIPYDYSLPSLAVDNHMICSVMIGDSLIVLDATEQFLELGKIGSRIQGKSVLIEDGDDYMVKILPEDFGNEKTQHESIDLVLEGTELVGRGVTTFDGDEKKDLKIFVDGLDTDKQQLFLSYVINKGRTNEFDLIGEPEIRRDREASISYEMRLTERAQKFGDNIYLNLNLNREFDKEDLVEEDRTSPIDFYSKTNRSSTVRFTLPEGLNPEYIPEPIMIQNDWMDIEVRYHLKDATLIYQKDIKIMDTILDKDQFGDWNDAIRKLTNFYDDQVILAPEN